MKLAKRFQTYLDAQSIACKSSTLGSYRSRLLYFQATLQDFYKSQTICKKHISILTPACLQSYLYKLNHKKMTPDTKLGHLFSIKKYLHWEIDQGLLTEKLLKSLDCKLLPKVPDYLPRPLSLETDRLLIKQWQSSSDPFAQLFLLLRYTGLRIGEFIDLPWDCVLIDAKKKHFLKVPLGKLNNERLLPLSEHSLQSIEKIKKAYPLRQGHCDQKRLIGLKGPIARVYEHLARRFRPFVSNRMDQGKKITFHRLRHTFATSLLTAGLSLPSLMKLLGHRRIAMTLRYAKVTPDHLRDEYLRALQVMEKESFSKNLEASYSQNMHPVDLLKLLATSLANSTFLEPKQKKNLLLRISRLKDDFQKLNFSIKITTSSQGRNI